VSPLPSLPGESATGRAEPPIPDPAPLHRPRVRRWLPLALALLVQGALSAVVRATPPGWDEPRPLRWARALEAHPVRTVLALGLALWALRPGPPGSPPEPPRRAGTRAHPSPGRGAGHRQPQDL